MTVARKKDTPCADCGTLIWRGSTRCKTCRHGELAHGTRRMYRERKCRCDECRAWAASEVRSYNTRRRLKTGESYWQSIKPAANRTTSGACGKCGKAIDKVRTPEPLCALCRGNRPGYNIKITPAQRLSVYERDGWVCQICTEAVDPLAPKNSTWDATLDHIVPRSFGGSDDLDNLRLAHRWCNSVRGDLSHHTDADLQIA